MRKVILSMSVASVWPTADTDPWSTAPMIEFARIWLDVPKRRRARGSLHATRPDR
jgi:hypothetical protein